MSKYYTVCCVVSCSNTQNKSGNVSVFRIPVVVGNQDETIRQLSQERRRLWLNAIRRSNGSWRKTEYWTVQQALYSRKSIIVAGKG